MSIVIKKGYLTKQGGGLQHGGLFKTWKKRFFVLSRTSAPVSESQTLDVRALEYFPDEEDFVNRRDPLGTIPLDGCEINDVSAVVGRERAFEIAHKSRRCYYCSADTDAEFKDWTDAIRTAIKGDEVAAPPAAVRASESAAPNRGVSATGTRMTTARSISLGLLPTAQDIPSIAEEMNSPDPSRQATGVQRLKLLLLKKASAPVKEVMDAGLVGRLVELLRAHKAELSSNPHSRHIAEDGLAAMQNIAGNSAESVSALLNSGAHELLTEYAGESEEKLRDEAIFAIGRLASAGAEAAQAVLAVGALGTIFAVRLGDARVTTIRHAARAVADILSVKPLPDADTVAGMVNYVSSLLYATDPEVLSHAANALMETADSYPGLLESPTVARLGELLTHASLLVHDPAVRALARACAADANHARILVESDVAPRLKTFLSSPADELCASALVLLNVIASSSPDGVQVVEATGARQRAEELTRHTNEKIRSGATALLRSLQAPADEAAERAAAERAAAERAQEEREAAERARMHAEAEHAAEEAERRAQEEAEERQRRARAEEERRRAAAEEEEQRHAAEAEAARQQRAAAQMAQMRQQEEAERRMANASLSATAPAASASEADPEPVAAQPAAPAVEPSMEDLDMQALERGAMFTKHGRRGRPHKRFVKLSRGLGMVKWAKSEDMMFFEKMDLRDITSVVPGATTPVFQRQGSKLNDSLCFSLIGTERTLDLECNTTEQRDQWVRAFRALIQNL